MCKLFCIAVLTVVGFNATAEDQQEPSKLQLTLSTKVWSEYVFNSGVVFHEKPVIQTDAFLQLRHGFYLDLWWSAGLNDADFSSDFGDEVDYTAGWSGEVGKKLVVDVGVSYFDIVDLFNTGGVGDVVKPYAKISRTLPIGEMHQLTPLFAIEWHKPLIGNLDGVYAWAGVRHNWQINNLLSVAQETGLLYDSGAYGFDPAFVWYANSELNWRINNTVSLQLPSLKVTAPLGHENDRDTQVVFGGGITFRF